MHSDAGLISCRVYSDCVGPSAVEWHRRCCLSSALIIVFRCHHHCSRARCLYTRWWDAQYVLLVRRLALFRRIRTHIRAPLMCHVQICRDRTTIRHYCDGGTPRLLGRVTKRERHGTFCSQSKPVVTFLWYFCRK